MSIPHVSALDLYNNGVVYEVVVMREDKNNGDIYFIKTDGLDSIDYKRIGMILTRRDAARYEAWDLFSQVTLANGVNALEYFHQLVMVKTRSGEIMRPSLRRAGAANGAPKLLNAQAFAAASNEALHNGAQSFNTPFGNAQVPHTEGSKPGRKPKPDKTAE